MTSLARAAPTVPGRSRGRRAARLLPAALTAVAGAALAVALAGGEGARDEIRSIRAQNDLLQKELELANGDKFYLVLDPTAPSLKLMLRGAVLQEYHVRALEVGSPRVAFVRRELPDGWRGRIWSSGNLAPARERERIEIDAPPPSKDSDVEPTIPIPPTPEQAYPVPPRYHVRYDGGLSLEIRRNGEVEKPAGAWNRLVASLSAWWADLKAVLSRSAPDADAIRLRLTLPPKEADSLYRALPPDTKLLVLPGSAS